MTAGVTCFSHRLTSNAYVQVIAKKTSTEPCAAIQNPTGRSNITKFKSRAKNATQNVTLAHRHSKHTRNRETRLANASAVNGSVCMGSSSHDWVVAGHAAWALARPSGLSAYPLIPLKSRNVKSKQRVSPQTVSHRWFGVRGWSELPPRIAPKPSCRRLFFGGSYYGYNRSTPDVRRRKEGHLRFVTRHRF